MAHRTTYPVSTPRTEVHIVNANAQGAGAANMVPETDLDNLDIVSLTRTGAGIYDIVFRYKYPAIICAPSPGIIGTTTGLVAIYTAFNAQAGTATVKFSVGGVATDPATTDLVQFFFVFRNSGRN